MAAKYAEYFPRFVKHGVKIGLLNEALLQYDLKKLGAALKPERDLQFGYLGLQTLYDRYFLVDQYACTASRPPLRAAADASSCAWRWAWR